MDGSTTTMDARWMRYPFGGVTYDLREWERMVKNRFSEKILFCCVSLGRLVAYPLRDVHRFKVSREGAPPKKQLRS